MADLRQPNRHGPSMVAALSCALVGNVGALSGAVLVASGDTARTLVSRVAHEARGALCPQAFGCRRPTARALLAPGAQYLVGRAQVAAHNNSPRELPDGFVQFDPASAPAQRSARFEVRRGELGDGTAVELRKPRDPERLEREVARARRLARLGGPRYFGVRDGHVVVERVEGISLDEALGRAGSASILPSLPPQRVLESSADDLADAMLMHELVPSQWNSRRGVGADVRDLIVTPKGLALRESVPVRYRSPFPVFSDFERRTLERFVDETRWDLHALVDRLYRGAARSADPLDALPLQMAGSPEVELSRPVGGSVDTTVYTMAGDEEVVVKVSRRDHSPERDLRWTRENQEGAQSLVPYGGPRVADVTVLVRDHFGRWRSGAVLEKLPRGVDLADAADGVRRVPFEVTDEHVQQARDFFEAVRRDGKVTDDPRLDNFRLTETRLVPFDMRVESPPDPADVEVFEAAEADVIRALQHLRSTSSS